MTSATTLKWRDPNSAFLLENGIVSRFDVPTVNVTKVFDLSRSDSTPTAMALSNDRVVLGYPFGEVEIRDSYGNKISTYLPKNAAESQVNCIATYGQCILSGALKLNLIDYRMKGVVWTHPNEYGSPYKTVSFITPELLMAGSTENFTIWDLRKKVKPFLSSKNGITSHDWYGPTMISSNPKGEVGVWKFIPGNISIKKRYKLICSSVFLTSTKSKVALVPNGFYIDHQFTKASHVTSAISPDHKTLLLKTQSGSFKLHRLS